MAVDTSFENITWWFSHYYDQTKSRLDAGDWKFVHERQLIHSLQIEMYKIQDSHGDEYVSNLRGMFNHIVKHYNVLRGYVV